MVKTIKEIRKEMKEEAERQKYERLNAEVEKRKEKLEKFKKDYSSIAKGLHKTVTSKIPERHTGEKSFKAVTKAYRAKPKLSQTLLSYGAGFSQTGGQTGGVRPVGRPAGVLKHRSPFTGKPIPATQFYKEMRAFRRVQAQQADVAQQQQQRQFARQGVPPQQIQNVVEQRMRQQFIQQQMQQQPQQMQQVPQQFQRVPGRPLPKLKFLRDIELQRGPQPFQQKWW